MKAIHDLSVIIAAYDIPGILAIEHLFSMGLMPEKVALMTHVADERNQALCAYAKCHKLETIHSSAKSRETLDWVLNRKPDVLFSLHYRQLIPLSILNIPRLGNINLHPSLLPNYRGCFSVPWSIIEGETETGYTYHYMEEDFDTGHILFQESVPVSSHDTAYSLFHKLIVKGLASFEKVFKKVVIDQEPGNPQPSGGSYYPRTLPHNGQINPTWDEEKIERFIRAMYFPPHQGATLHINHQSYEVTSLESYRKIINSTEGKVL